MFDTAYNSNENLLVSAPTGAGKTNIALLTITHEIRNHIKDGCLLYTSPSPRDKRQSRMPSSA